MDGLTWVIILVQIVSGGAVPGQEPSNLSLAVHGAIWITLPYLAYFIGIFINNRVWGDRNEISISQQLWLGVPCSLVISTIYILTYLQKNFPSVDLTYAMTMGIIMFNGFSVTSAAEHFKAKHSKPPEGSV
jgi:hypothetical protein